MATATIREKPAIHLETTPLPEFRSGDRMDQKTFMLLGEAMPDGFRVELIGGVVIAPPPYIFADHAENHCSATTWLGVYQASTPGTRALSGPTIILGEESQPEPDWALLIRPEFGGQTKVQGKFVSGAPELVFELSSSSYAHEIHSKKRDYEEAGIGEYVVFILHPPRRIVWFVNRNGKFKELERGADGIFRSTRFPGLWLDPQAAVIGDGARILQTLNRGLETPEHAAFVDRLKANFRPDPRSNPTETLES